MSGKRDGMPFLRRKQRGLGVERGRIGSLPRLDIGVVGEIVGEEKSAAIPPGSTDEIGLLARAVSDMTGTLRNRIDAVAEANQWRPYRSVVVYLMYHLQEDNLVLL